MRLITRADGVRLAVWDACDALVIRCLCLLLTPVLPVSHLCEHVRGHGGGKASVRRVHDRIRSGRFPYVCRTDIRGYYAHIRKDILYDQLCAQVASPLLRNLLYQFLHYSVEEGGEFHTPVHGIPRGSSLSPLLAAFHLYDCDRDFAQDRNIRYVRYMDDFVILADTRWHLRKAIRRLNGWFEKMGFEQYPDKTFIGRVGKGFDWMGFWFNETGCQCVAPRAVNNFLTKLRRLYERTRHQPAKEQAERVEKYFSKWLTWLSGSVSPRMVPASGLCCLNRLSQPLRWGVAESKTFR